MQKYLDVSRPACYSFPAADTIGKAREARREVNLKLVWKTT
jgi:hypothetical protein